MKSTLGVTPGSESRIYRDMLEAAPEAMLLVDGEGRIVLVNTECERIFGYPRDDLLGLPVETLVPEPSRKQHASDRVGYFVAPEPRPMGEGLALTAMHADGHEFAVEISLSPVNDGEFVCCAVRDISERRAAEQAREGERVFLHALLESMQDGIVACDPDGVLTLFNRATREIHGLPQTPIPADEWANHYNIYHADGVTPMETADVPLYRALQGERVDDAEIVVRAVDGSARHLLVKGQRIVSPGDVQLGAVVAMHDITERIQTERALATSEQNLAEAQRIASIGSWQWDTADDHVTWSDELYRIFGRSPGDVDATYEGYLSLLSPGDRERMQAIVSRALNEREPYELNHQLVRADGAERVIHASGRVECDATGTVVRLVGTAQDITERTRNEQRLALLLQVASKIAENADVSETGNTTIDSLRTMFPDLGVIFATIDRDGNAVVRRAALPGRDGQILGDRVLPLASSPALVEALMQGGPVRVENTTNEERLGVLRGVLKEIGSQACLAVGLTVQGELAGVLCLESAEPRHWSQHEVETANAVSRQLTLALAQESSRQARDNVMEELETQATELRRSNEELERFAYVASHDMREPLRTVASYAQLLQRRYGGKLDDSADDFIEFMVDAASRMQRLIQDLLAYSRVGRMQDEMARVELDGIVDQVLADMSDTISSTGAVIEREALPSVWGDALQLGQVLQNIVGNAIKFCGDAAPHIQITADSDDSSVQLTIRDFGIGIDESDAKRIFEIFQRVEVPDREPVDGTGIGLAICKKIVDRHGGRIWIEAAEPGTKFHVKLPVAGRSSS